MKIFKQRTMRCSDAELSQQRLKCIRSIHPKLYTLYIHIHRLYTQYSVRGRKLGWGIGRLNEVYEHLYACFASLFIVFVKKYINAYFNNDIHVHIQYCTICTFVHNLNQTSETYFTLYSILVNLRFFCENYCHIK